MLCIFLTIIIIMLIIFKSPPSFPCISMSPAKRETCIGKKWRSYEFPPCPWMHQTFQIILPFGSPFRIFQVLKGFANVFVGTTAGSIHSQLRGSFCFQE